MLIFASTGEKKSWSTKIVRPKDKWSVKERSDSIVGHVCVLSLPVSSGDGTDSARAQKVFPSFFSAACWRSKMVSGVADLICIRFHLLASFLLLAFAGPASGNMWDEISGETISRDIGSIWGWSCDGLARDSRVEPASVRIALCEWMRRASVKRTVDTKTSSFRHCFLKNGAWMESAYLGWGEYCFLPSHGVKCYKSCWLIWGLLYKATLLEKVAEICISATCTFF